MARQSILIVDDNSDFCEVAATILRGEGFAVDQCSDVRLAIARAKSTSYSAVVLEPSPAAGFAPLFEILDLHHVIAATTEDDEDLAGRLADAGVFCVVRKPLTRQKLQQLVRACCGGRP